MSTVHDLTIGSPGRPMGPHAPAADRPALAASQLLLIADGAIAGALAGSATLVSLWWAPWWVLEIVGFLTAPVLLVMHFLPPQGALATAIVLVVGTMILFCAYAEAILHSRTEEAGALRFMVLLLVHAACLIVWIGMVIGGLG